MQKREEVIRDKAIPPWRIGVDVGGTFTDLTLIDTAAAIHVFKVPSTPDDPTRGVLASVRKAAVGLGISDRFLLESCSQFVHGSTVATNVLVTGRGARVGLLVTEGFRDSLEIRRGMRSNAWDHRTPYPPVLVPRYLRLLVHGRIDRSGRELDPLRLSDIDNALETFRSEGVQSIAICLYNSFLNDCHEREVEELVRDLWPEVWVTRSSALAPVMGEYERTSTTVVNAYLAPYVVPYIRRLSDALEDLGLQSPLLLVQNNGGALTVAGVERRPVSLLFSGPAGGVGALTLFSEAARTDNVISMEIGGTSCDVMLLKSGKADVSQNFQVAGYHVALSSVDIHTVGAGGGTIAGVDEGSLLTVGPEGAGARPGPACYGFGGSSPTVTDAQLVLGRLEAGSFADGALILDQERACGAIESLIAKPLKLDVQTAAAGIIRLVEQSLLHSVERVSGERGYDPRQFTLIAAGGAGPMHGAAIGRKLGCRNVYIPRLAGVFCALGMLVANVRHEFGQAFLRALIDDSLEAINDSFDLLVRDARSQLAADGFKKSDSEVIRELDIRYAGQIGSITVTFEEGELLNIEQARQRFAALYESLYGYIHDDGVIEVTGLRAVAIGVPPKLRLPSAAGDAMTPEPDKIRSVYFEDAGGLLETSVYAGGSLRAGHTIVGPALIEELTTSVVIGPNDILRVDETGNYVIRFPDLVAT